MSFLSNFTSLAFNCRQALRLQSNALDRKLSFAQRFGLRLHLLYCRLCRRYGQQIRHLRCAAHQHNERLLETGALQLSTAARDRIKQRIKANG